MKTARLLSTVAAAMLLTAGVASAQVIKQDQPGAVPAPGAQQKAPAEKMAPPMHSNAGMKADKDNSPQNKADVKHETTGQAPKSSDMDKSPVDRQDPIRLERQQRRDREQKRERRRREGQHQYGAVEPIRKGRHQRHHRPRRGAAPPSSRPSSAAASPPSSSSRRWNGGRKLNVSVSRGNPRSRQRALLSAAGGSGRDLSGVARIRLHSGRRRDRRDRPAHARDRAQSSKRSRVRNVTAATEPRCDRDAVFSRQHRTSSRNLASAPSLTGRAATRHPPHQGGEE